MPLGCDGFLEKEARAACDADAEKGFPWCATSDATYLTNVANKFCEEDSTDCGDQFTVGENNIEASYLYQKDGEYFLFVNYYWCCRALESTYEIWVGRGKGPQGPFFDRSGKSMAASGGTRLLGRNQTAADGELMVCWGRGPGGVAKDNQTNYWRTTHTTVPL